MLSADIEVGRVRPIIGSTGVSGQGPVHSRRRRLPYDPARRQKVAKVRKQGACIPRRIRKVNVGFACLPCATSVRLVVRLVLRNFMALHKMH